jgi:hypothetical protein
VKVIDVGIHFRMAFLPGEQGEKFKTNLYDHGSGGGLPVSHM